MDNYRAPVEDMQFLIDEVLDAENRLGSLPCYAEAGVGPDLTTALLDEAAKLANDVVAPLRRTGDLNPAQCENGKVICSPGHEDALVQLGQGGWTGIAAPVEMGGQGLPELYGTAASEMWNGANMAFALAPFLSSGAALAIAAHGSDELKRTYAEKINSGEWSGTMNLTESGAGSDLGPLKTRAVPDGDHYRIYGQKIYITWGEHEMTDNIVHLVLARLPDAPEGVKGISLFLVPKYLVNEDGTRGERNDLKVVSVESKMGIHSSPTCVMSYGDKEGAIGYLVGEEHQGLACMFTMMNNARLEVGMQGVAIAERACQQATSFAGERVQGVARGHSERSTIIHHPDVRRMLMQMRTMTEAGRALAYYASAQTDLAHHAAAEDTRAAHQSRVDLIIPIVKSWCTEMAQE